MKKKVLIILSIIVVITIFVVALLVGSTSNNAADKTKEKEIIKTEKCINLEEKQNKEETFVLFITDDLSNGTDQSNAINKYLRIYEKNNIMVIDKKDLKEECMINLIKQTGVYSTANDENVSTALGFIKGSMIGGLHNFTDFYTLEDWLDTNKVIAKKEISEEITLDKFKEKKSNGEYLILIFIEEEKRDFFTRNMEKVFIDCDFDVVNRSSKSGKAIDEYIKTEYKKYNDYPRLFYFKNNKLIKDETSFSLEDFKIFKNSINS